MRSFGIHCVLRCVRRGGGVCRLNSS